MFEQSHFINFKRLKSTFLLLSVITHQKFADHDTVGPCNAFILSSMSLKCVRDHIIS